MKNFTLILLFCVFTINSNYAQVGVGTTNPEATLDIRSSSQTTPTNADGILIPKINNFPTINPTAAKDGMMVYVTGIGTPTKGFYYWDIALFNWVAINSGGTGWSETGNTGTNSVINFIGTTDAQDLTFRTNNIRKMRLTQKGQLEFFNTGLSVFIGDRAGENDDLSNNFNNFFGHSAGNFNTSGAVNNFFGFTSGRNNTTGSANSFFGHQSGLNNTTGGHNSIFGHVSGVDGTTAFNNAFFGSNSGRFTTTGNSNSFFGTGSGTSNLIGSQNVAVGENALSNNLNGSNNVAVGRLAGLGTIGHSKSNGVFIGYEAGRNEDNDNRLYIENSDSATPLIYGEFDTDILRVNGTLQVNNPTLTGYSLPESDGTTTQVFQTDGNGVISFVNTNTLDTNDWSRNGNAGTNPTANFIGTIDARNLSFRTNNIEKLQLTQQGQLEFLNTGNSIFIGEDAGTSDDLTSNFNTYIGSSSGRIASNDAEFNSYFGAHAGEETGGFFNSYLGSYAGNLAGGERNTYVGYRAGANSVGSLNTFIGSQAGEMVSMDSFSNIFIGGNTADNFTQGNENVLVGTSIMRTADGNENVVIGARALEFSANTTNNVVIGFQAAGSVPGAGGCVIIGNQAGQSFGALANNLIIHNSDDPFPLIYGEFDNRLLALNGSVAINHDAPQAPLHVKGFGNTNAQSIVAALESNVTSRPVLLFSDSPTINLNSGMSLEYNGTGNSTTNKLVFNGIGGNALYEFENGGNFTALAGDINIASGDLVIETVAGDREIRMGDNAGNNDRVMLRQDGTDHIFIGDIDNNGGNFTVRTGGANAMTILSGSRNVGIGLTNPTFRLQVSTNSAAKPTSQLWTVVSDRRLKKDVRSFTDGLETLKQIDPIWFTYNGLANMPSETGVGTIAQQLEEVAPYLVKDWEYKTEDGQSETYKAVDYGPLTFIIVNAIKEQATTIEQLTRQLEDQQTQYEVRMRSLEERLAQLEN